MKQWHIKNAPSDDVLDALAELLRAGGVALLPTDTIYGLHAVRADAAAVAKIAAIKGRPEEKAFVVIAESVEQLAEMGVTIPEMLSTIWPAPLTAILPFGQTTIAVRVPDLAWLRDLLRRTGPLVSTSANRSGAPPVTRPELLDEEMRKNLDAILDLGSCEGKPSTIVDVTGERATLVREGDPGFVRSLTMFRVE